MSLPPELEELSEQLDHVASLEEVLRELEWRKSFPTWDIAADGTVRNVDELVEGFKYFTRKYVQIRVPGRRIPFELFDAQEEVVRTWLSSRQSLALKARQIGFSTVVSIFCLWVVLGGDSRTVLMISRKEDDAAKLLRHARLAYRQLPEWFKQRGPLRIDNNTKKLSFSNESWIDSLPSASDPGRGETAFITVVDEIGFLPNSEQAWASIEPTIDVGGRVIMLGTANGIDNLLYRLWEGAKNGANKFRTLFFSWRAREGRDDEWYQGKIEEFKDTPHLLHQEYPDNPDEAFVKSGRMVFTAEHLERQERRSPVARGFVLADGPKGPFMFQPEDDGPLRIWDFPRPGHAYVIGVDVAEGLEHGDFSSIHVIDARGPTYDYHRKVVATWHGHVEPDLLGSDVVAMLGWWYNTALVGVEINVGTLVVKELRRVGYRNLFKQRRIGSGTDKETDSYGFRTTKVSKPHIIYELNGNLREGLDVHDDETLRELMTYTRDEHGRMSGSPHDDRVMSLAIANHMLNYAFDPEYQTDVEPGPGTMGFAMKVLYQGQKREERVPIGGRSVRNPV